MADEMALCLFNAFCLDGEQAHGDGSARRLTYLDDKPLNFLLTGYPRFGEFIQLCNFPLLTY